MRPRKSIILISLVIGICLSGCLDAPDKKVSITPEATATVKATVMPAINEGDVIIGTWQWIDNRNIDNKVEYVFKTDGTFTRYDSANGIKNYKGKWTKADDKKYHLVYAEPSPGYVSENLYYNENMDRLYTEIYQFLDRKT
ncbi:hypothetical protein CUJ83_08745 [Methanocella sp. CWC-04]|uniref:Uncharacterized protein n=1 Tax=Methanooceanicella nereidis TaxID=2052831 RepID=A0AAP2RCL2_9EURY|nr:hypothetical protein [Methanocella sp. CWC-04]MCD1295084.1 hypothetical protein [Methanocella sp. CWC-04]